MLTKEKLQAICNNPITMDDLLIKTLHELGGVSTTVELSKKLDWPVSTVNLQIKKSFYVQKENRSLVRLNRKGKEPNGLYNTPEYAENIHDYVFSFLVQDYNQSFKGSLQKVIDFCTAKNIDWTGYLNNSNIFATVKKEVKKYLTSKGVAI